MTLSTPSGSSDARKINVMLVDDSAVIRGALGRLIDTEPHLAVVGSIPNGELAIAAAEKKQPDIVILDIEMPVMDGITALPQILKASPKSKVIMFSSLTEKGASITLKAFSLGAVECLVKPTSSQAVGVGSDFQKNLVQLINSLGGISEANIASAASAAAAQPQKKSLLSAPFTLRNDPHAFKGKPKLVAIGSSTGGPNALFNVIKNFKGFDIPIVITQHMPATFTKILAQHINQQTGIPACEGEDGQFVENGKIYVAPGDYHMRFKNVDGKLQIVLGQDPPVNFCRPAVDPMFMSLIDIYGARVLGVILTGMGNDGLGGGKKLIEVGGRLIAQDEATSTVWGMPGAVAKAGLCTAVLPLDDIGPWVRKAVIG